MLNVLHKPSGRIYKESELGEVLESEGIANDGGKLVRDQNLWAIEYSFLSPPFYLDPEQYTVYDPSFIAREDVEKMVAHMRKFCSGPIAEIAKRFLQT